MVNFYFIFVFKQVVNFTNTFLRIKFLHFFEKFNFWTRLSRVNKNIVSDYRVMIEDHNVGLLSLVYKIGSTASFEIC